MPRDRQPELPPIPAPLQLFADGTERPQMLDENVWIDVIQKMDEVYSDLLQYEVALEEKNATLEETQQFVMSVLTSMSDILVVCSRNGTIEDVNRSLVDFTGRTADSLRGPSLFDLCADDVSRQTAQRMFPGYSADTAQDCELQLRAADGSAIPSSVAKTASFCAAAPPAPSSSPPMAVPHGMTQAPFAMDSTSPITSKATASIICALAQRLRSFKKQTSPSRRSARPMRPPFRV